MTVPTSSLIAMGAAAAFCALLPIGILIWWRRTERVRLLPALWGALAFLLFARGLEMGLHYLCILSDNAVSRAILSSPVALYALRRADSGHFRGVRPLLHV